MLRTYIWVFDPEGSLKTSTYFNMAFQLMLALRRRSRLSNAATLRENPTPQNSMRGSCQNELHTTPSVRGVTPSYIPLLLSSLLHITLPITL